MAEFYKLIKDFVKAILFGLALAVGIFACAILWVSSESHETKKNADYVFMYDSLMRIDKLKDRVVIGQMKARKDLEIKNDSLKKVLLNERKYVWKVVYPKHKKAINQLFGIIIEQKKEIRTRDSLLVYMTDIFNNEKKE